MHEHVHERVHARSRRGGDSSAGEDTEAEDGDLGHREPVDMLLDGLARHKVRKAHAVVAEVARVWPLLALALLPIAVVAEGVFFDAGRRALAARVLLPRRLVDNVLVVLVPIALIVVAEFLHDGALERVGVELHPPVQPIQSVCEGVDLVKDHVAGGGRELVVEDDVLLRRQGTQSGSQSGGPSCKGGGIGAALGQISGLGLIAARRDRS